VNKKNPHVGSSFESWLDEVGIREEVTIAAMKAVMKLAAKTKRRQR
jgi:antitoxin HicB